MSYTTCILYNLCSNKIVEVTMIPKYEFGEEFMSYCGYTDEELHYIFLGELE